jgi:hypothetical protein
MVFITNIISPVHSTYLAFRQTLLILTLSACSWLAHSAINIPDLSIQQLHPHYWQNKLTSDEGMSMKNSQVEAFNQHLFASDPHMVNPLSSPDSLTKASLEQRIKSISSIPTSTRFYADGKQLTEQDYKVYLDNLNMAGIKMQNPVHFALVAKRSVMRTFPTLDRVFNEQMDLDLDRFQETAVFPGEAVAILHSSTDGQWLLVQNYNYLAWVQADGIAIGDKQQIQDFIDDSHFLLITGAKVMTNHVPAEPGISQVQLDMGVKLPLVADADQQGEIYQQSTSATYQVKLPTRNDDGSLAIKIALIGLTQDVHIGYLSYTPENVIAQAFKFLGERYGWGHDYNGRDCTGFVGEIYKTFGILMPRNSGQQGKGEYGTNFRFDEDSDVTSKLTVINNMQIGDLIYIPGHVMMYLGNESGQPFVIHDVKGLAYWTPDGEYYSGVLNAVSVTPLIKLHLNKSTTYVDKIYNIKRITLQNKSGS